MKRIVHFHARWLCILLASSFLLFHACEQEDITKEEIPETEIPSCDENTMESNFFDFTYISNRNKSLIGKTIYTDEQKILIQEKIQDIRVDNCRERFVSAVVSTLGYFIWDRAIVGEKSDGIIGIITPSIHPNTDTITSVLVAEKKEDFSYYRIVKKDVLEGLQMQETAELLERLQFLESIEKDLFGEKRPIGIEGDDFYLLKQLEEPQIESRSEIFQVSTCKPIALRDEEEVESRSCPPGTVEFIDIVVVPCAGNDGDDSGDNSDNSCAFCDVDYGGSGSTGGGGDSDSDDGDDSNDTDFDVNGDPLGGSGDDTNDDDCSNPIACEVKHIEYVSFDRLAGSDCSVLCQASGKRYRAHDPSLVGVGVSACGDYPGSQTTLAHRYSRGVFNGHTDAPGDESCRIKIVHGDGYWEFQVKMSYLGISYTSDLRKLTIEDDQYECKISL